MPSLASRLPSSRLFARLRFLVAAMVERDGDGGCVTISRIERGGIVIGKRWWSETAGVLESRKVTH